MKLILKIAFLLVITSPVLSAEITQNLIRIIQAESYFVKLNDALISSIAELQKVDKHAQLFDPNEYKSFMHSVEIDSGNCKTFFLTHEQILYCSISLFTRNTVVQLTAAVTKGLNKRPRGIIIDLRGNHGGTVQAAVDCAGIFLAQKRPVVSVKNRSHKITNNYITRGYPLVRQDIPIIMLVNQATASAAEIFAQALKIHSQDAHRGKKSASKYIFTVGTPTAGKGSVQTIKPLSNGCGVKLTTGLYFLPNNTTLDGKPITPDFVLKKKDKHVMCACNLILLLDAARITAHHEIRTHDGALNWLKGHTVYGNSLKYEKL